MATKRWPTEAERELTWFLTPRQRGYSVVRAPKYENTGAGRQQTSGSEYEDWYLGGIFPETNPLELEEERFRWERISKAWNSLTHLQRSIIREGLKDHPCSEQLQGSDAMKRPNLYGTTLVNLVVCFSERAGRLATARAKEQRKADRAEAEKAGDSDRLAALDMLEAESEVMGPPVLSYLEWLAEQASVGAWKILNEIGRETEEALRVALIAWEEADRAARDADAKDVAAMPMVVGFP